jgi:hypothetical protein
MLICTEMSTGGIRTTHLEQLKAEMFFLLNYDDIKIILNEKNNIIYFFSF